MRRLSDLARQRIAGWMESNPKVTQTTVARAVGVTQGWVSRYKSGEQEADIDQLDAMARAFDHTLAELLDLRPDPRERDLLDAFRKVRPEARKLAIQMIEAMTPPTPARGRTRTRSDE